MIRTLVWTVVLALAGIILSGCAEYQAGTASARILAATVADAELRYGAYISCVASSLGANGRAHGQTAESWEALRLACLSQWGLVGPPVPLVK